MAKNIQITSGDIGSDKPVLGQTDYLDKNGSAFDPSTGLRYTAPQRDGRLVDGALAASVILDGNGKAVTLNGRAFLL